MTTVVFVEKADRIEIAFDSKVSYGFSVKELEQKKVFKIGKVYLGVAGSLGFLNLLSSQHIPDHPPMTKAETDRWVQRVLIPIIKRAAVEYSPMTQHTGYMHSGVLVAVNGYVYDIGGDFSWVRNKSGIYAIGSGSHYATGAVSGGSSAKRAVEVATQHDAGSGYTVHEIILKRK